MLKKTFILIFFIFLTSCGYKAMHSKQNTINTDFSINQITFIGDREINLRIKRKLNNYTLIKKDRNFSLIISSNTTKLVSARDGSGDPISFQNIVTINVEVLMNNKNKNNLKIVEKFNYNNSGNRFSLKKYEREIKNNLTESVLEKLIYKLSNIQ
jgi:outer membrane lipopolysaccharide assembly protein LptE/RlpB